MGYWSGREQSGDSADPLVIFSLSLPHKTQRTTRGYFAHCPAEMSACETPGYFAEYLLRGVEMM
jgi:hypothetical protein